MRKDADPQSVSTLMIQLRGKLRAAGSTGAYRKVIFALLDEHGITDRFSRRVALARELNHRIEEDLRAGRI